MMADLWSGIWTIARKDLTEWFSGRGGSIAGLGAVLGMVVAFGVLVPLIGGAYWLAEPWHLLIWPLLPMFFAVLHLTVFSTSRYWRTSPPLAVRCG